MMDASTQYLEWNLLIIVNMRMFESHVFTWFYIPTSCPNHVYAMFVYASRPCEIVFFSRKCPVTCCYFAHCTAIQATLITNSVRVYGCQQLIGIL